MAHADTVTLFAAGSLTGALTEVARAYEAKSSHKVATKFGPSGLLKKEIADGAKADVFASANMEHPQALFEDGTGGPVLRAIDKKTGEVISEFKLPANQSGHPMTYMLNGRQYIVVAVGARNHPAELVALRLD